MKRSLLSLFLFYSITVSAQTRYWVGASGGAWSNAANWSTASAGPGGASVPAAGSDVIFNNAFSGTVSLDVIPATTPFTYTINSILVTGNANVTLARTQAGGGIRILQVSSVSTTTKGLQIDAGNTLTIDAVNTSGTGTLDLSLSLTGAAGVTGEISGNLYFRGTGTGDDDAELDLSDGGSNFAALVVKSGGVIKYFNDTGNTSPSTGSFLTMENGSTYEIEKNGGSFPPGTWQPNSLAKVFNATGANGPSFNGITYGDLEWNCPAQNFVTLPDGLSFSDVYLISTNSATDNIRLVNDNSTKTLTINGNLTIDADAQLVITTSVVTTGSGTLNLKGNLIINAGGELSARGGTGATNKLIFNGTTLQTITNNGTLFGNNMDIEVNNSAGVQLLTNLVVPGGSGGIVNNDALQITSGKIFTSSSALLTIKHNANYTRTLSTSDNFVQGPMKKIGSADFWFPIGTAQIYAPLQISGGTGAAISDEFTAEYIRANPQGVYGTSYEAPINHVSFVEYWTLDRNVGAASKIVTLDVHRTSFVFVPTSTFISRYNSGDLQWKNLPATASGFIPCGSYQCGLVTTNAAVTTFSPFTLATDLAPDLNPLPIRLVNFDAVKTNSTMATINWQLAVCCSKLSRFDVLKSVDGTNFNILTTLPGNETETDYTVTDNELKTGITYYRLKGTDAEGKVTYSRVVAIVNGVKGLAVTSIWPNPAQSDISVSISSATTQKVIVTVYSISGAQLFTSTEAVASGHTIITKSINNLPQGYYQLSVTGADGTVYSKGFIKR